jgi:hypothetical protein
MSTRKKTGRKKKVVEVEEEVLPVTSISTDLSNQTIKKIRLEHPLLVWTRTKGQSHAKKHTYVIVGVPHIDEEGQVLEKASTTERRLGAAPKSVWVEEKDEAKEASNIQRGKAMDTVYIPFASYQSFLRHFANVEVKDSEVPLTAFDNAELTPTQLTNQGLEIYITGSPSNVIENLVLQKVLPEGDEYARARKNWLNDVGFNGHNYQDAKHRARFDVLVEAEKEYRRKDVRADIQRIEDIITIAKAMAPPYGAIVVDENDQKVAKYGKDVDHPVTNLFTRKVLKWAIETSKEGAAEKSINISRLADKINHEVKLESKHEYKGEKYATKLSRPVEMDITLKRARGAAEETDQVRSVTIPAGTIWTDSIESFKAMIAEMKSVNAGGQWKYTFGDPKTVERNLKSLLKLAAEEENLRVLGRGKKSKDKYVKRRDFVGKTHKDED